MAEQPGPINHQVGQQPRSINKQFGQLPRSINQQVGQEPTSRTTQQYAGKTPSLRTTFDTMLLFCLTEGAYAYCICCCDRRAGSPRQGTPLTDTPFRFCRVMMSALPPKADIV